MLSNFRDSAPILSNSHDFIHPKDEAERVYLEALVREDYNRAHPADTFDEMKRRAPFSPEDQGLYRDWLAVAAASAAAELSLTSIAAE